MTSLHEDIAEQQADITRLLLQHFHQPLGGDQFVRGVLPAPPTLEAIRIVTGRLDTTTGERTAWELPLRVANSEELYGPHDVLGILRALHTGTHIHSSSRVRTLMDMPLVQVDVTALKQAPPQPDDDAFLILSTLVAPYTEHVPDPRLRGFLFQGPDRLRLYMDRGDDIDVIAADVRPSGAVTALLAALPSLLAEEERRGQDDIDPHCTAVVDLTRW
ncbi:hypothetical protein [Streptomyces sp. NPDC056669]|uniref:hypothetical protein n=1 Tax=unclassified Streptomyces TaxID=2593676 RepID=UPI00367ABD74